VKRGEPLFVGKRDNDCTAATITGYGAEPGRGIFMRPDYRSPLGPRRTTLPPMDVTPATINPEAILQAEVTRYVQKGYRVVSQTARTAQSGEVEEV
jgi:hypothetical protein